MEKQVEQLSRRLRWLTAVLVVDTAGIVILLFMMANTLAWLMKLV